MLTHDMYGKTLSASFQSSVNAYAQRVKPKVVITFLDSRHVDNLTITVTGDTSGNSSRGDRATQMNAQTMQSAYFFTPSQSMNGIARQTFTWGVCDAKDQYGKTITADGTWYVMPSDLDDNFEYGWMSNASSTSNVHSTYGGYEFSSPIAIDYTFTQRKVNKIKVSTSEFSGKIQSYKIEAYNNTLSKIFDVVDEIEEDQYLNIHSIPDTAGSYDIYKIVLTIYTTRNPLDKARVIEVEPLYEVDITDYIINHSVERVGELYESSIPIGGGGSSTASITLDNTTKVFNPFNESSTYGKYMKKDLKVNIYNGWSVVKSNSLMVNTVLTANMNTSVNTMSVSDASGFLDGNSSNTFTLVIAPNKINEERVLCSTRTDKTVEIISRGYQESSAQNHTVGEVVSFDPFEYINFGEFYVDEWTGSSSMEVTMKCIDKTKFLTEAQVTKGFHIQNATVGEAIENLMMRTNISRNESNQIYDFEDYGKHHAVAMYSFSEFAADRSGLVIIPGQGLRMRVWKIEVGKENTVKDITADALDRELSAYDRALRVKAYIPADYVAYSGTTTGGFNSNTQLCVDISDFSFTKNNETYSEYFNGVIDGYFIPTASGNHSINISTRNAGVRAYLDNTIIMDYWNNAASPTSTRNLTSYEYLGFYLNLDAGVPYKLRIEFYHGAGAQGSGKSFEMDLYSQIEGNSQVQIPLTSAYTTVVEDAVGTRNVTSVKNSKNRNHYKNDGLYIGAVEVNQPTGLVSKPNSKSVKVTTSSSIVIPYDESLNLASNSSSNYNNGEFTMELYVKFPTGSLSNAGTYVTNVTNSNSVNYGFTFFYNSVGNGFTLHDASSNKLVSSAGSLDNDKWYHICVTHKNQTLKYYLNGNHVDTETQSNPTSFGLGDITIANSSKDFLIDEFVIYNKCLDGDTIKNRYISTQIKPLTKFPHLYGNEKSVKQIIDDISLGDFGRFFVDENNKFTYYHFYRFYEPSIDQHYTVQKELSGNSHIISGEYNVQLQVNKVTVEVTDQVPALTTRKPLWNPPDGSTLASVTLRANIGPSDTVVPVNTTNNPPFNESGYIKISNEIIKYNALDSQNFLNVERAQFDTTAESHYTNDIVREARYYEIKYEGGPAFNILFPFVTSANTQYRSPTLIEVSKFITNPYSAELVLSATSALPSGNLAYVQGTNPLTGEQDFTSIAGIPIVAQEGSNQVKKQTAEITNSIKRYGTKEIVVNNPYIVNAVKAQEIADFMISKFGDPVPVLNITSIAIPQIQIGDRIRITELSSLDIVSSDYWVISHNISFGDTLEHQMLLRKAE